MTIDKGIQIKNVYHMLAYAFKELKQSKDKRISNEHFDNIYDLFAEILAMGVSSLLKQGLHKEYITRCESLITLKGKLDIKGTVGNRLKRSRQLYCSHDDLSENYVFNQIIKTTINSLVHNRDVKAEHRAHLKKVLPFFCNVDIIDARAIKWTTFRFDRNTSTYEMLINICYFVLHSMLLTTDSGNIKINSFSDNCMCRLYEKFILEYYRKHHPELHPESAIVNWNIKEGAPYYDMLPEMRTDVMLHFQERTLIIDAKYYGKTMQTYFGKRTIHSSNLYQIQSYVNNYDRYHSGKVDGMLLYAKTDEQIVPNGEVVSNDGNRYYFKTLDLNQEFDKIKEQLDGIAALCASKD